MIECIVEMLKENDPAPKVVRELVRCKDCQRRAKCGGLYYCTLHESIYPNDDWYCADGVKKDE